MGRMKLFAMVAAAAAGLVWTGGARAATPDGTISPGEYTSQYKGGGTGFDGTLGNGTIYMQADASKLYIGFQPGNVLNDLVAIHLDTRPGGFTDADMNDTADGGRRAASNLSGNANDIFPAGALPDYALVIGNFGIVLFELNAGNTPGHLAFKQFDGTFTGNSATLAREVGIPLSTLGNPTNVNFFASYVADGGFGSNESIPAEAFNAGPNPGDGTAPVTHANFASFSVVPEPSALGLLAVGAGALAFRRRRA